MNEKTYKRVVVSCIWTLRILMVLIAMAIPLSATVHPSILNKIIGKVISYPQVYCIYFLFYMEVVLGYLLCMFLNFQNHDILTLDTVRYLRRIGQLMIIKDFAYLPVELVTQQSFTLQFQVVSWVLGGILILFGNLLREGVSIKQEPKEKKRNFQQVVLPVIWVSSVMLVGILVVSNTTTLSTQGALPIEEYVDKEEQAALILEEDQSAETYIGYEAGDFYEENDGIHSKESTTLSTMHLKWISNESFEEKLYDASSDIKEDARIPLDFSDFFYYPNIRTLLLEPIAVEYNGVTYYYEIDQQGLTQLTNLQALTLEYMNISDLSFLKQVPISSITFRNCNFTELAKEEYQKLSKIKTITLEGELPGIDLQCMMENLDAVKEVTISDFTGYDEMLFANLPNREGLEVVALTIDKEDKAFYDQLLQPCTNLKSLYVQFDFSEVTLSKELFELEFLEKINSLEQLSIQGDLRYLSLDYYLNDRQVSYDPEKENPWRYLDGTVYEFDLWQQEYHDFTYISKLNKLTSLTLSGVEVTDLSFLSELTNLKELNLSQNLIGDVTPLQGLTKLEHLDLSFNGIKDISPLSGLQEVRSLSIGTNLISSIEAIRGMKKLESLSASSGYYYYEDETYSTQRIMEAYYKNATIPGSYSTMYEFTPKYNPKTMEDIENGEDWIYKSEEVYSTGWVEELLNQQPVAEGYVTIRSYLANSVWELNQNRIVDLSPLETAKQLRFLDVSSNEIKDISPIQTLTNLEFLSCMQNQIEDVSMVTRENFPRISYVYLSQNNIQDGSALQKLAQGGEGKTTVQYYMTPYYNQLYLGIAQAKSSPVHMELMGIDVTEIFLNALTGLE